MLPLHLINEKCYAILIDHLYDSTLQATEMVFYYAILDADGSGYKLYFC